MEEKIRLCCFKHLAPVEVVITQRDKNRQTCRRRRKGKSEGSAGSDRKKVGVVKGVYYVASG